MERDRIGRDLQDLVVRRIFATGMHLQGALKLMEHDPTQVAAQVNRAVDELDGTIRDLRSTIYDLRTPAVAPSSLRSQLVQAVDRGAVQLDFRPGLLMDGPIEGCADAALTAMAVAVVQQGLANVARHAASSSVEVTVSASASERSFTVQVEDDGDATTAYDVWSGLADLQERARQLGGSLAVSPGPVRGTRLRWTVPSGTSLRAPTGGSAHALPPTTPG